MQDKACIKCQFTAYTQQQNSTIHFCNKCAESSFTAGFNLLQQVVGRVCCYNPNLGSCQNMVGFAVNALHSQQAKLDEKYRACLWHCQLFAALVCYQNNNGLDDEAKLKFIRNLVEDAQLRIPHDEYYIGLLACATAYATLLNERKKAEDLIMRCEKINVPWQLDKTVAQLRDEVDKAGQRRNKEIGLNLEFLNHDRNNYLRGYPLNRKALLNACADVWLNVMHNKENAQRCRLLAEQEPLLVEQCIQGALYSEG